jgi:hypothetical protein
MTLLAKKQIAALFCSIELSPFLETTVRFTAQEYPNILWNPKIQYCVHKILPLVSILSQINPVHTASNYFSKVHFNSILLVSLIVSFLLAFPLKLCMHSSSLPYVLHALASYIF